LRGGIPICWPWFGALDKNPALVQQQVSPSSKQAHGFVRSLEWDVDYIKVISSDETELQMSIAIDASDLWPFDCQLVLKFTIGARLTLSLAVHNNDTKPFYFTNALHSYFAAGDIRKTKVYGLNNKLFVDALNNWGVFTQQGDITIDREIDRIYEIKGEDIQIVDGEWQRQISIISKSSANAIVWNPWIDKSKWLSQFKDSDFKHMLCVESANVGIENILLEPNERHIHVLEVMSQALPLKST
jgi:glucose-6-phosphate 1-epimerase